MISVTHVLDDGALGGVTRFLDALDVKLAGFARQERIIATPTRVWPTLGNADVVVIHFTMSWSKLPYLLALRAQRGKKPIVLVEHSYSGAFERDHVPAPNRFRTMLKMAYSVVDQVVAVSFGQAAWMRRASLLAADKLSVIRPFTNSEELGALASPETRTGPLRLGAYGRYCVQKDFGTLIEAMRGVDPSVAHLSLRGFGPDGDLLRSAAAGLPHVAVGGKVEDLKEFLAATDVVVVPSCFEPFGQVALEARLAGRPVIVTAVDGLPEQVELSSGLIVPARSPIALGAAIREMASIRGSDDWHPLCRNARTSALDHIQVGVKRWRALFNDLGTVEPSGHRAADAAAHA